MKPGDGMDSSSEARKDRAAGTGERLLGTSQYCQNSGDNPGAMTNDIQNTRNASRQISTV